MALDELAAISQQLPQFPEWSCWDEALGDEAVPNQIGDPLGILYVSLATRHIANVPGIADDQLKIPFQHSIDRAPVDSGALHADVGHPGRLQPVA